MNLVPNKAIATSLITLLLMGILAFPSSANASWNDILGTFGIGGSSNSSSGYNSQSYDYNSTSAQSDGDIKMTKEVKEIGEDDSYHDKIQIRSGALVEVWIEVKNTSSNNAPTIVRDEIGGNTVYVKNSLRVNNQVSQPGLTSGGLRINIPAKSKATIIYRMNVCGNSGYPMRAYASASGIGASTDAIIITTENYNVGGFDNTSLCLSQFQNIGTTSNTVNNVNYGNPFGDWTGVNNSHSVPFTTTTNPPIYGNPFGDWTGVNNTNAFATPTTNTAPVNYGNPFGDWTGVRNDVSSNPFGDWTGVQNNPTANPVSDWTGVRNDVSSNPFGDWTGVQTSNLAYDERGYSTNASQQNTVAYTPTGTMENNYAYAVPIQRSNTNFVAPTTGVNGTAPFIFAGILTLAYLTYKKRELIFA